MNLPNALSVARIVLIPLLVVVLLTKFEGRAIAGVPKEYVAAAIFLLAALTDWLDGYLARRRQQVTALGQWLDPLADKLLITAALVSLVQMGRAPAWMVAIIIGREIAVTGLRSVAQTRGYPMPASPMGKLKMAAQVVAVLFLILGPEVLDRVALVGLAALWVVTGLAIWSAVDYYVVFSRGMRAPVDDTALYRPEPAAQPPTRQGRL
jgi:CDP-diacylglycerol--glycerol-3-phosphate 3-phosphatidyltransferase